MRDGVLRLVGLEGINIPLLDVGEILLLLGRDLCGDAVGLFLFVAGGDGGESKEGLALLDDGGAVLNLDIIGLAIRVDLIVGDDVSRVFGVIECLTSNYVVI
jgi:hypothetical protein